MDDFNTETAKKKPQGHGVKREYRRMACIIRFDGLFFNMLFIEILMRRIVSMEAVLTCDICSSQFAHDDVIKLHDKMVCAKCKPLYLQQIREGVVDEGDAEKNYKVAYYQRRAVQSLLFMFLAIFISVSMASLSDVTVLYPVFGILVAVIYISMFVLGFLMLFYICMLAASLTRWYVGIICFPFLFLPLISLIVLVVFSGRATALLKKHGYKVGFIGVSKNTLKELKAKAGK